MRRKALSLGMALAIAGAGADAAAAQAPVCQRSDFEAVVDEAAAQLRVLNQLNRPKFQDKLRELKEKRGWSHAQFMKDGLEFVRDDKITEYDQRTETLLAQIASGGDAGASAKTPDCAVLVALRLRMKELVATQQEKWSHMFEKIGRELAK